MTRKWLAIAISAVLVLWAVSFNWGQTGPGKQGQAKAQAKNKGKQQGQAKRSQRGKLQASEPTPSATEEGVPILSSGDSYDDFASLAKTSDGTLFAAYAAYYDGHDQVRIHQRLPGGNWSSRSYVPLARPRADIWMPQLAVDAQDRLWVIWAEQTGQSPGKTGNWDLYARNFVNQAWGPLVRLTNDPKPDINPHVTRDSKGNLHVVWQAHPDNRGAIQLCRLVGNEWSKPFAITDGSGSDWYPRVAVDSAGVSWIAFDSYRNGDYDVFLTSYDGQRVGPVVPIATSKYYEAHPSVACTPDGKVWVSWEQGGFNWGKDQGYWLKQEDRDMGTSLGGRRSLHVVAVADGKLLAAPDVGLAQPEDEREFLAMGGLTADSDGRLWLRYRHKKRGAQRRPGRFRSYWNENVTYLTKQGWAPGVQLPGSDGRISVFSRELLGQDGNLYVAYASDQRRDPDLHQPQRDQVLIAEVPKPSQAAGTPELAAYEPPAPPAGAQPWDTARENQQVEAIRNHRVKIDGVDHRIVRGDLHRHTELSWDVGPGNDGSYLDFYRYMIDVAQMDFGGLTDHQGGGHYAYWWWLSEKSADMYYLAPRFVPLYGYERSVTFPNGHRNVFHAYRGVPIFPFQLKLDQTGQFPGVSAREVVDNDTKLLYEYLERSGGVCMPHTSGTSSMGTDWRDNNPNVEPVVEIYQGARNSYEVLGGPRVHPADAPPQQAPGGFQREGLVWNAWAKGYRLGIISASDHGSTHISYALVYTPENDRQAILDSIRKRHTYGATDNLIVDVTLGDRFMGDDFESPQKPALKLRVQGTEKIARIDLVRNAAYLYTTSPLKAEATVNYVDMEPEAGENMYYFRIQQDDGQVAWSSPIWVKYEK